MIQSESKQKIVMFRTFISIITIHNYHTWKQILLTVSARCRSPVTIKYDCDRDNDK